MEQVTDNRIIIQQELIAARKKIQGDESHCFEVVGQKDGVVWINHSMATTMDLTWLALRDVEGPVVLILGGTDRSDDQYKLRELVGEKATAVVCLGTTPWKYVQAFSGNAHLIVRATYIQEAVKTAHVLSKTGARTVLFAPGCPSYDAFDNYRNRGNAFRDAVRNEIGQ